MVARRRISKGTTAAPKKIPSDATKCPGESNPRRLSMDSGCPESPRTTEDSRVRGFDGMRLEYDVRNPLRLLGPIDDCLSPGEEENGETSSDQVHPSSPPLACSFISPVDHLLMECLLDNTPFWKRSLLLHCMWLPFKSHPQGRD